METYSKKEIALWIAKYLQGILSEEEGQKLEAWRKESARHEAVFQKYLSTDFYGMMKALYTPGEEEKLYRKFRKQLISKKVKYFRGGNLELCSYLVAAVCMGDHALSFFS